MSNGVVREFRAGLTWSFAPERFDDVLDAVARLPDEFQDACVFSSGSIEFDVEIQAQSFEDAKRIVIETVIGAVRAAGLVGQPESVSATDDVSWASWQFVNGRFVQ